MRASRHVLELLMPIGIVTHTIPREAELVRRKLCFVLEPAVDDGRPRGERLRVREAAKVHAHVSCDAGHVVLVRGGKHDDRVADVGVVRLHASRLAPVQEEVEEHARTSLYAQKSLLSEERRTMVASDDEKLLSGAFEASAQVSWRSASVYEAEESKYSGNS